MAINILLPELTLCLRAAAWQHVILYILMRFRWDQVDSCDEDHFNCESAHIPLCSSPDYKVDKMQEL